MYGMIEKFKHIDEKKSKMIQFVVIFGLLTISYYSLSALGYLNTFANRFAVAEVKLCGPFLKHFYRDVLFSENYIMVPEFRVNVNFGCDGTEPIFIFIFAVLAFPSSFLKKIPALILGSLIIYFVNGVRGTWTETMSDSANKTSSSTEKTSFWE